ncbi:MAG TPA: hypothetical protein VLG37_04690 [Candidatus Saccharimonadales bacterium]|nr:hypothetical protein [Candidatus Saccharimonadales bacterium]
MSIGPEHIPVLESGLTTLETLTTDCKPLSKEDRLWLEALGCKWPIGALEEATFLEELNSHATLGSQPLDWRAPDQNVLAARRQFFTNVSVVFGGCVDITKAEPASPDQFIGSARFFVAQGLDPSRLRHSPKLRPGTLFNIPSFSSKLEVLRQAVKPWRWGEGEANAVVESAYTDFANVGINKLKTILFLINTVFDQGQEMTEIQPSFVARVLGEKLEVLVVGYLLAGLGFEPIKELADIRHRAHEVKRLRLESEKLLDIITYFSGDPAAQVYLENHPLKLPSDEAA